MSTRLPQRRSLSVDQKRRLFLNQRLERVRHRKLQIENLEDRRVMAFNMTLAGSTATVIGDAAADTLIIDQAGGLLQHNRFTVGDAGFNSNIDWDNTVGGDQTLAAAVGSTVNITTLGDGDDVLRIGTVAAPMSSLQALIAISAAGVGNDSLVMENSAAAAMTINYSSNAVSGPGINISNLAVFELGETLNTGAAGSITTVTSSANSLAVVGLANSTLNLGTGTTANIAGAISILNTPALTTLNVNDSANAVGRNVTWTGDTITGLTGNTITYVDNDVTTTTITTGTGADTFNLSDSISAATNTINSGDGADIFNVTASGLAGSSTNNYNGQGGDDTFNITGVPAGGVTVNVDGGPHTTGDTLNINAAVAVTLNPNSVTTAGGGPINFTNIESLTLAGITAANFVGTAAADVLTVDRASAATNRATFTGATPYIFPTGIPFTFDAQGGDDELSIAQNATGLPLFGGTATGGHTNAASGVALAAINANFIGGAGANDRLRYTFTSAQTAAYFSDTAAAANSGVVTVGGINLSFEGLAPVIFAGAGGSLLVDASANAGLTTMTVSDDPANTAGAGGNQVTGNNAFETAFFRGFASVTVRSGDGADTINLTSLDTASTETAITLDSDNVGNTDNSADIINVASLPATVTATLLGGQGADTFNVGSDNTLVDVLGAIVVSPIGDEAGAGDTLNVSGSADAAAKTVLLTTNTIEGMTGFAGTPDIAYGNGDQIENVNITTTAAADAVNVQSTRGGSVYGISTLAGADTIVLSSDAPAGVGNLNAIEGQVNITTGTEIDTVRVSDIGDAAADTYTLNQAAGIGQLAFGDGTAAIDVTWAGAQLENFILNTSNTGGDTLNVQATSATTATSINSGGGNDTWTITGDALSATNIFNSDTGNDSLTLNIATHIGSTALFGIVALTINAGDPASTSENRDRLVINDSNAAFARDLNYDYQNAPGGLNILAQSAGNGLYGGNGGGNLPLNTTGLETVIFNSGGTNDAVRVTGTAANDLLTVGLLNNATSATVFLGGTPYLEAPPASLAASRPGIAGGGVGPDLLINGISTTAGLRLFGDGNGGTGDRAIVYASSENPLLSGGALDIFGFGAGVLIPGFGVGNAYDRISVNGAIVAAPPAPAGFTDVRVLSAANADIRVPVFIDTTSFVQATPPSPTQQAAVIVNGGDEAVAQASGIADNIYAAVSPSFNIQVNGNLPNLVLGPNGFPVGDQLNITGPGDLNIFSDKATPPNVTVTFSGNASPFGITNSSIERLTLVAGNGVVNLIGDNNDPAVDQNDNFVVVGRDIDGNGEGVNELTLEINGSAPILIDNVFFLNAFGDDQNPPPGTPSAGNDIDTLELTPYADDTPRGWGIDVGFNEGNPTQADGNQADLLILHTSLFGGQVSENIVIKPSGPDNGEIIVTNASFGTPIVDIDFVNNTEIIILDDDGFVNDTDSLTLLGTNPDALQTSGNETFAVNSAASQLGGPAGSLVTVSDTVSGDILYRLRGFLNPIGPVFAPIASLTIQGLAGNDTFDVSGPDVTAAALYGDVQVNFLGGEGDDVLDIDLALNAKFSGTGLFYDGGTGADSLIVTGGAALATPLASTTYTPGAAVGAGKLTYAGGALANMVIDFVNLEPVVDLVVAPLLIVNANNASNAINYGPGTVVGRGLVSIDDHETIEFANKVALEINALAGNDSISVSPVSPVGLTGVTIAGGAPGAGDTLTISGTTASEAFEYAPTGANAGTVTIATFPVITFGAISAVVIDGGSTLNDDTLTVRTEGGTDVVTLTPGVSFDSGTVQVSSTLGTESTPTLTYLGLGQDASLSLLNGAGAGTRQDLLVYEGTSNSDAFAVTVAGTVSLNAQILVNTAGINGLRLNGQSGNDTFAIPANHPFALGAIIDGGNPDVGGDVLTVTASGTVANLVTANLAGSSIQEATFFPVTYLGVEVLNVNAAAHDFTVLGSTANDSVTVDPTGAAEATIRLTSASPSVFAPVVNASGIGATFTVDLLAGSDNLRVNGTQAGEIIAVSPTAVTVGALKTVTYAGTENLQVFALAGSDTINVTPSATTTIFVDGGDPIGTSGDTLNLSPPGAFTLEPGPEPDEGGMAGAGVQRVSWDHIEDVIISGGGPGLILGTNGDDDITIIARDVSTHAGTDGVQDFTVTVNDSFSALFINQPTLFVDALAGDDDIVVRAPAPNAAVWNVQITLVGGPPASATGDQGDVLEFETPGGADQVIFTPTGPESGTFTLDQATDSVISFVTSFIFDPAGINYTSSPGGIEKVVYDGVSPAGFDNLTINGTIIDDTLNFSAATFGGNFHSIISPAFEFSLAGRITFNGNGGFDVANLFGSVGDDLVTSTATAVTVDAPSSLIILTLGTAVERLTIDTGDGNDNIDLDLQVADLEKFIHAGAGNDTVNLEGVLLDPADPTIYGGDGDDIIFGSPNPDLIYGGSGNDLLRGGGGVDTIYGEDGNDTFGIVGVAQDPGADFFFGGDGSDLFIWNPGDGNDLFEGGAGESDRLQFEGNDNPNSFILNQVGTRLEFLFGAVDLDLASTEEVDIITRGGIDTVTINDIHATEVRHINVDSGAGGAADTVTIQGREVTDTVSINNVAGVATVVGLRYDIRILNAVIADNDVLIFNANGGNDAVTADDNLQALYAAANLQINGGVGDDFITGHGTLSGGAGNDTLSGGSAGQTISGGDGNDLLLGGAGDDSLLGGDGEDTFVGGLGADTIDGGLGFDTVLIQGTSADDRIDVRQDPLNAAPPAATSFPLLFEVSNSVLGFDGVIGGAGTETDTIVTVAASTTVENVSVQAGSGADIIRVGHDDSYVGRALFTMRLTVDGGPGGTSDRLVFRDLGIGDTTIQRISEVAGAGSYTLGTNAPVVYSDVEFAAIDVINAVTGGTGTDANGRLFVFKADPFEQNPTRPNATHLGANAAYNVDPVIDPASDALFGAGGDEDWYRVVAQYTGTLDFTIYFRQQGLLVNGRAGLPGDGNLQLEAYDALSGAPITGFGSNENAVTDADERIRMPVVAGQSYYFRVNGAPGAINVYGITTINTPAPVARDLELDDVVAVSAISAAPSATGFTAPAAGLSAVPGYYVGKFVYFLSGALNGQRAQVATYNGAGVFTFAAGSFTGAPAVGDQFQIESIDSGRSQFDNHTRDNTPTIFLRLDDASLLNDLPGNPAGQTNAPPPDQVIPITYQLNGSLSPSAQPAGGFAPGFRIAIFDETDTHNPVLLGYATPVNATGLYTFTFTNPLSQGSHFITAKVEMIDPADTTAAAGVVRATGFGGPSVSLEIVVDTAPPPVYFGLPTSTDPDRAFTVTDGLHPDSDTGVDGVPLTFTDNITANLTPRFYGTAEANSIVRLYLDNLNVAAYPLTVPGVLDAFDVLIDQTVANPEDGTNQLPTGWWEAESTISFNDPQFFPVEDGLRTVFATAEDLSGNVNPAALVVEQLQVFIDTVGPQVTDVRFNSVDSTYNVFDHKYESVIGGDPGTLVPTPLVNSIIVKVRDLPARVANFVYQAIYTDTNLVNPVTGAIINGGVDDLPLGLVSVVGDYNGEIPIRRVTFTADQNPNTVPLDPFVLPDIARGYITITFGSDPNGIPGDADDVSISLPDDRFTLTVEDEIRDPVGNRLDGESQTSEPHDAPIFPSGDGIPGGDFVARFTVDTRPELGTWAAGSAWIDINGNQIFDQDNLDFTNRDIAYLLGYTSDELFAGNFAATGAATADGFDKLAAYGRVGGQWRWQIDTDNDGVPNIEVVDPSAINGFPVAGNFGANAGDEVGVFTGNTWYLDTDHDFQVNDAGGSRVIQWVNGAGTLVSGYGFVGDFDGDGNYDLGSWTDDTFQLSLSSLSGGLVDGVIDRTFHFGFAGARERPVAADMNMDGIDDIGLWSPDRATQTDGEAAEWYWLMSGVVANDTPGSPLGPIGPTIAGGAGQLPPNGRIVPDPITLGQNLVKFTPVPFGNDLYMQFGDEYSLPIVGNFDPPATLTSTLPYTNNRDHLDVNNDGRITAFDALAVINRLNRTGAEALPTKGFVRAPFVDVNNDSRVTAFDALWVINYLNAHPVSQPGAGEDVGGSGGENTENDDALLAILGEDEL